MYAAVEAEIVHAKAPQALHAAAMCLRVLLQLLPALLLLPVLLLSQLTGHQLLFCSVSSHHTHPAAYCIVSRHAAAAAW